MEAKNKGALSKGMPYGILQKALLRLRSEKEIILIIAAFIIIKSFFIVKPHFIIWDEAVYIGMGKYIFSGASVGLWEPLRPVFLPLILGFLWKIGLNYIFLGELLIIIVSAASLWLTYKIALVLLGRRTAVFSALLFAATPVFIEYSSRILTEILSAFLGLAALYFLIAGKNTLQDNSGGIHFSKFFVPGIFLGLSFITRFPQGILFLCFALFAVYSSIGLRGSSPNAHARNKKYELTGCRKMLYSTAFLFLGFIIIAAPFFIFSHAAYGNFAYPIISASYYQHTPDTAAFFEDAFFYLRELFYDNPLFLFSIIGLTYAFAVFSGMAKEKSAKNERMNMNFIILMFSIIILYLLYFSLVGNKQLRFALSFIPYLSVFSGAGLSITLSALSRNLRVFIILAVMVVSFLLVQQGLVYAEWRHPDKPMLIEFYEGIEGSILSTDPTIVAYHDVLINNISLEYDVPYKGLDYFNRTLREIHFDYVIYVPDLFHCGFQTQNECDEVFEEYRSEIKGMSYEIYRNSTMYGNRYEIYRKV